MMSINRMTVGAVNYTVGVMPGFIRFLLMPLGIRSDGKDVGIQQLETAAAKGKNSATDARLMLIIVYNREKRYNEALKNVTELHERYPRNFIFELAQANTYGKLKRWDDAIRTYEKILTKVEEKKDGYERLPAYRVHYSIGSANIERYQFETALTNFDRVVQTKEASPNAKGNAYLWMGKIYDSSGRREQALKQYDAILGLNCDSELKSQAQQFKRKPFK